MNAKAPIYRIVIAQFIATFTAALLCMLIGKVEAYSVLLGGLTVAGPNTYMAWRVGREVAHPGSALKYLVKGELGKLALTAVMFALVFYWVKPLAVGYFFMALVIGMLCNILIPLVEAKRALKTQQNKVVLEEKDSVDKHC